MSISRADPLWAALINSNWRDYRGTGAREDRIWNDGWLASFLHRAGWEGGLPGRAERESLARLRMQLGRMVECLMSKRSLRAADVRVLNDYLALSPLVPRLEHRGAKWSLANAASSGGIKRVAAAVAHSFASMMAEGDPGRVKACANPDCGWIIYDESHNRTRRWCDVRECGNLVKVRRFRARGRKTP